MFFFPKTIILTSLFDMQTSSITQLYTFLTLLLFLACGATETCAQRIVSLGPINTENVYALGAGDRLVGNTSYCVRPEAARAKAKIGSVLQVSVEKIISLHPDLVLATALTRPEQIRQLQAVGIRVVRFKRTASFAEICAEFLRLGGVLGLEAQAEAIIAKARGEVAEVEAVVVGRIKPRVFIQVGAMPLFGAVPNSFTHDFIVLAGGINIIADQKTGTTSLEKVIGADPEIIIIGIMGSESGIAAHEKQKWLQIPVIRAVQKQRVHIINPDLICSPSPLTFARTLKLVTGLIHPEVFKD